MAGPLVSVNTITAGIGLEVDRLLYLGKESELEFLTPDRNEVDGWKVEATVVNNFNRMTHSEDDNGDGSDVIYKVADLTGSLGSVLRLKDLHIRVLGDVYKVSKMPPIAPNEAQVYTLICGQRMLRTNFDATK